MTSATRDPERRAIEDLVRAVPELRSAWEEHLAYNDEALPRVFMGDASRFALRVVEDDDQELVTRLSAALEEMAASDYEGVVNLIHVSFVEFFVWGHPHEQKAFKVLKKSFGPAMLQRIREFEEWSQQAANHVRKFGFPGRNNQHE